MGLDGDYEDINAGRKYDAGKLRYDLLPARALESVVRVLGAGAAKYGDNNWVRVAGGRKRYFAAAMRHTWAWWRGEELDPETGEDHLAHAMCCLMFLMELGRYGGDEHLDPNSARPKV